MKPDTPGGGDPDELLALQLRVARRADELVRTRKVDLPLNLECWLLAESEVLGGGTFAARSGSAPANATR